jgi:hypothetical protein
LSSWSEILILFFFLLQQWTVHLAYGQCAKNQFLPNQLCSLSLRRAKIPSANGDGKYYLNKPLNFYRHDELTTLVFYWCPLQIFWIVCRLQLNYQRFYRHVLLRDLCLNLWANICQRCFGKFLSKEHGQLAGLYNVSFPVLIVRFLDPIENSLKQFFLNVIDWNFSFLHFSQIFQQHFWQALA